MGEGCGWVMYVRMQEFGRSGGVWWRFLSSEDGVYWVRVVDGL